MKKATLHFILRMDRAKNGKYSVVVRIYTKGLNKYVTLPVQVFLSDWLPGKERTKNNLNINKFLDELSSKFNLYLIESTGNLDVNSIAKYLFGKDILTVLDYMKYFVEGKKSKKEVKWSTISRYIHVLSVFEAFLKDSNQQNLLLKDLKIEHIHQFDFFIKTQLKVNGGKADDIDPLVPIEVDPLVPK